MIVLPLMILLVIVFLLLTSHLAITVKILGLVGLDFVLTLILAKTLREFYIILFMLPLCTLLFYTGILQGIYLRFRRGLIQRQTQG